MDRIRLPSVPTFGKHRAVIWTSQTAEISYRRYWLGYTPRISGTLLAGFRYTRVNENFQFSAQGSEQFPQNPPQGVALAALDYKEDCDNNLAGFQTGGDIWVSLCQGIRFGTEAKVGIYDNHSVLANRIATTPSGVQPPALFEEFKDDHAAFISEGSFDVVADILPSVLDPGRLRSAVPQRASCWPATTSTRRRRTETKAHASRLLIPTENCSAQSRADT